MANKFRIIYTIFIISHVRLLLSIIKIPFNWKYHKCFFFQHQSFYQISKLYPMITSNISSPSYTTQFLRFQFPYSRHSHKRSHDHKNNTNLPTVNILCSSCLPSASLLSQYHIRDCLARQNNPLIRIAKQHIDRLFPRFIETDAKYHLSHLVFIERSNNTLR